MSGQFREAWSQARVRWREADRLARMMAKRDAAIAEYLSRHEVRKLQLGSWANVLDGWLCSDLDPPDERVVYIDATQRLPLEDESFDYIYSEHLVEHLPFESARAMLGECFRVLRPGGRLRIATPDLRAIAGLGSERLDAAQERYLHWAMAAFFPEHRRVSQALVVNNLFRAWGHQFLFDEPTLRQVIAEAGFVDIIRCEVGESHDPHLRGIEQHGLRIGEENNRFETMVLEARRP